MPRCLHCKTKFTPKTFLQKHCLETSECYNAFDLWKKEEIKKSNAKKWKVEKAVMAENVKGKPGYLKDFEREVNRICCLIDFGSGCISCNGHTTPQAGHYHTVKSNGSIRFNLDNLHLQDFNCNCKQSANIPNYDLGLIDRYGKEYWEYVKFGIVAKYPLIKLTLEDLKEKISIARGIVKYLKLQERTYTNDERLDLRKQYNQDLGIY